MNTSWALARFSGTCQRRKDATDVHSSPTPLEVMWLVVCFYN